MTNQTEIDKDKEAVAKMIGAKSAMEAALRRIETLEVYGARLVCLVKEMGKFAGENARINSHYNQATSEGFYSQDVKFVSPETISMQADNIKSRIIETK